MPGPKPRLELRRPSPAGEERPELATSEAIESHAAALDVPPDTVRLAMARGATDRDALRSLLNPQLKSLRPPTTMAGFDAAVDVLAMARRERKRVGIFGDYDVDGVTTTTILSTFLETLGMDVVCTVATREAGYGFQPPAARALVDAGVEVVLTGDCGTSDHEALGWLREQGIPVVVIDHHMAPEVMPPTTALLNPHQPDCEFPFKGLCSAGVAFYLCAALRTAVAREEPGAKLPDPRAWLDLVALGTICDMVPLVEENRVLVRHGLSWLDQRKRPGLRALLERANVRAHETLDEGHVGFQIGPRLNAPGRLTTAEPSLSLLRARSVAEARPLAAQVEMFNSRRRAAQEAVVEQAASILEADERLADRCGIVVADPRWEPGVVGIAANGIVERYRRPTLVVAIDSSSGEARGSARSYADLDVRSALAQCGHLLERFGGHRAAAGVTMAAENVPGLVEAFDEAVRAQLRDRGLMGAIGDTVEAHDGERALSEVGPELMDAIDRLRPYGMGFPAPVFVCSRARIVNRRVFADKHVELTLVQDGPEGRSRPIDAVAFRRADASLDRGDEIGTLFTPYWNTYGGRRRVGIRIERMWRAPARETGAEISR